MKQVWALYLFLARKSNITDASFILTFINGMAVFQTGQARLYIIHRYPQKLLLQKDNPVKEQDLS